MTAFYNEVDPLAAQWLRNLISAGHIAPGIVDERPIQEIEAFELSSFTQCHFFAGIGAWSYALRQAGWSDDRPIWTGSCPCQPFSNAGTRKGISDERHLWPYWHPLIEQRKPSVVIGEQVASKDGLGWLDLVSADMEASDYAFGAGDLCAAGFDGAHIRQRLYFVGVADAVRCGAGNDTRKSMGAQTALDRSDGSISGKRLRPGVENSSSGMADSDDVRPQGWEFGRDGSDQFAARPTSMAGGLAESESIGSRTGLCDFGSGEKRLSVNSDSSAICGLADEPANGRRKECADARGIAGGNGAQGVAAGFSSSSSDSGTNAPMLGRNAADWLYCRDGKWRPVEPGTFPLAHAAPARVGRLRAYGNALDAETATQFCRTVKEICDSL